MLFLNTCMIVPLGQDPETVIGVLVNRSESFGDDIVAPDVGGADGTWPVKPIELEIGGGL
jgi:hypothetical protein